MHYWGNFFLLQKNDSTSGLFYFILKVNCTRRRLSNLWRKSEVIEDAFLGPIFFGQWSGAADNRRVAFLVAVVFYGAALVSPTPNPPPFSSWTWDQAMVELKTVYCYSYHLQHFCFSSNTLFSLCNLTTTKNMFQWLVFSFKELNKFIYKHFREHFWCNVFTFS